MSAVSEKYSQYSREELIEIIREKKSKQLENLLILAHHYQNDDIVALADFRGDSYALAKRAVAHQDVKDIIFCGVHFMAESAAILAQPYQRVFLPDTDAGCPMADMADEVSVGEAWRQIGEVCDVNQVVPITYINSHAELKAFCGRHGGIVCTSSNASAAMEWARSKGSKIFFFPDQHLGRNTAKSKGYLSDEIVLWDPALPKGGISAESLEKSKVILWKGHCHVHTFFSAEQVREARDLYSKVLVVVHPECDEEVVALSDAAGSTSFIIEYVFSAPVGTTIVVGTELNLVKRLDKEAKFKKVVPLANSICHNMAKITLQKLAWQLDNLDDEHQLQISDTIRADAKIALDRMLEIN